MSRIRTLVLRDGAAEMGVGGGIVWDSEPASEYAECLLKARFLTEARRTVPVDRDDAVDARAAGFHLLERHLARLARVEPVFRLSCSTRRASGKRLSRPSQGLEGVQRVRLTLGVRGDAQVEAEAFALPAPDAVWRYAFAESRIDSGDWRVSSQDDVARALRARVAVRRAATGATRSCS